MVKRFLAARAHSGNIVWPPGPADLRLLRSASRKPNSPSPVVPWLLTE